MFEFLGFMTIVGWLVGAVVNGSIAAGRKESGIGAFFLSLLFSPILIWMYLIATPAPIETKRHKRVTDNQEHIIRLLDELVEYEAAKWQESHPQPRQQQPPQQQSGWPPGQ